ncbi:MAG: FG-GAP-like repeat-containing protein [Propionibacteriaceae bacterium]|nr:FG-GAP-like repeat-containing protein [Propionibacteriaceae bacterium]
MRRRIQVVIVATAMAIGMGSFALPSAQAAVPPTWDAGLIITDAMLTKSDSMSATQVQTFLAGQGKSCQPGEAPCLKDYTQATRSIPADKYCQAYAGATNDSAAQIIAKVGKACGINPQVLVVMLQKEMGLVSTSQPSQWQYTIAMGYGCPDNSVCDTEYYGFQNQIYWAAHQFKVYAARPGSYTFQPQAWNVIPYNPSTSCGSSRVYIQNQATASLYNYTPYQPNQAALENLYGQGDSCSAYGNRNFWTTLNSWFPSAPILLSSTVTSGTVKDGVPFTIDFQASKALSAGKLTITNSAGKQVGSVATSASSTGTLKKVTWDPGQNPAGAYTWTLAAADSSGRSIVDATGNSAPTGTITVAAVPKPVLPMAQFTLGADMTGDGRGETLAVDSAGTLWMFPGQADGTLGKPVRLGTGFTGVQVFGPGDLNSDGKADILAITKNGDLWLYPGNGANPLKPRVQVGSGWTGWRLIPVGDLTGDGKPDLLGINPNGLLFMYAGLGTGKFATRVQVGWGWTGWKLYAAGDLNSDGKADILGINAAGLLFQYTGKGNGTFNPRQIAGSGWNGYTMAGGADLNGDGRGDILGRNDSTHVLYYYQGLGNAKFAPKKSIATGW